MLFAAAVAACNGTASTGGQVGQVSDGLSVGAVYNFGTLAHPGACLDANGGGTANGTQIQEWWCNGSGAQAFALQNAGGGAYTLVNTHANKCVDVAARGTANGTKIQLYDCNRTPAQSFFLQPAANGFVTLVNTNSGKCLDVAGDNPADGTVVQLYDCNGTNAQLWNPAVISGGGGGGSTRRRLAARRGGGGSGMAVHVTNGCPVDVWIHGAGAEGTLQPDNAHLAPGAARDYDAPATWSAARIYAYLQAPDGAGNPQGQNDKVEMNFGYANGVETINTDITYVDWVALPSRIQAIGSGSDCTTVGCEVPYSHDPRRLPGVAAERPRVPLRRHVLPQSGERRRSDVPRPRRQHRRLRVEPRAAPARPARRPRRSTPARARSSATARSGARRSTAASSARRARRRRRAPFYQNPPYNPYAAWVHARCPGIYAFPYDDYGNVEPEQRPHLQRRHAAQHHVLSEGLTVHGTAAPIGTARRSGLPGGRRALRRARPPRYALRAARGTSAHSNSSLASPLRGERSSTPPSRPLRLAYILAAAMRSGSQPFPSLSASSSYVQRGWSSERWAAASRSAPPAGRMPATSSSARTCRAQRSGANAPRSEHGVARDVRRPAP